MKTLFTIIAITIIAGLFAFNDPLKNSSGAQAGHTGSPGDGKNCTFCHGGTAQAITDVLSSNIPVSGYAPGETYTITVATSGTGRKGFQVSPQSQSGALQGILTEGTGNKLVGGGKYVTHSSGVTAPAAQWSFSWTAPAAGTGSVVFYGAFVIGQPNVRLSTMQVNEDETIGIEDVAQQPFIIHPVPGSSYIKISFQIPEPSIVGFELIDLAGRVVSSKDFGWQNPGTYSDLVLLDRKVQQNIYLGVLSIGGQKISKKIIL